MHWVFYYDGTTNIECASSSDGIHWTQGTSPIATNPNIVDGTAFSTWYNYATNTFYLVYTNNNSVAYRYGNLSSSGCSSINWLIPTGNLPIKYNNALTPTIAATSPDNVWITVLSNSTTSGYHIEVWNGNATSGSFSLRKDIGNFTTHAHSTILPLSSSNEWSLVYSDDSGKDPVHVTITADSGSTWSTPTSSNYTTTVTFDSAATIGNTTFVLYRHGLSYYFYSVAITGTSSTQQLIATPSKPIAGSSISVNATTNQVTVIYANESMVYYRFSSNDGASFGPQQILSTGNSVNTLTLRASYYQGPNDYVSVIWTNGTSAPFDVIYAAISSSSTTTTTSSSSSSLTSSSSSSITSSTSTSTSSITSSTSTSTSSITSSASTSTTANTGPYCNTSPSSPSVGTWMTFSCYGLPPSSNIEVDIFNNSTNSYAAYLFPTAVSNSAGYVKFSVKTTSQMVGQDTALIYSPAKDTSSNLKIKASFSVTGTAIAGISLIQSVVLLQIPLWFWLSRYGIKSGRGALAKVWPQHL